MPVTAISQPHGTFVRGGADRTCRHLGRDLSIFTNLFSCMHSFVFGGLFFVRQIGLCVIDALECFCAALLIRCRLLVGNFLVAGDVQQRRFFCRKLRANIDIG